MNYKFHLSVLTGAALIAILVAVFAPGFSGAVGPTSNPPGGNITPTFSGLDVDGDSDFTGDVGVTGDVGIDGLLTVDGDYDGTNDLDVRSDGEVHVNNFFRVDANNDSEEELVVTGSNALVLGYYPEEYGMVFENHFNTGVLIDGYHDAGDFGWLTLFSPDLIIDARTVDFENPFDSGSGVEVDIEGNLNVSDKITSSNAIGSFYTVEEEDTIGSSKKSVRADCIGNDIIISCSGYYLMDSNQDIYYGTYMYGAVHDRCRAWAKNGGGANNNTLKVFARCFDPQGIN